MIANFIPEVLDAEPGDELRLGLEDVERRAVLRGDAGDDEGEERELADHRIGDEPQPRLRRGDVRHPQRSGEHHRHQRREQERQVVGNDLVDRAHHREQRVLVVRAPPGHEQADDLHRRHGQEEQHAGVEIGDAEPRRERDRREDQQARHQEDDRREVEDRPIGARRESSLPSAAA